MGQDYRPIGILPRSLAMYDVENSGEKCVYKFVMPGIKKENIDISVTGNQMQIKTINSSDENSTNSGRAILNYSFTVAKNIDLDKIFANLEDGILYVSCPYKELVAISAKKIEIT